MNADASESQPRRLGPVTLPRNIGPLMLFLVSAIGILAVFWGRFVADPGIEIELFDAGPTEALLERAVVAIPEQDLYLVGLEDGRVRAVDGRVEFSGCAVDYRSDDPRGRAYNPHGVPGVLEDPCSGAVWSVAGDAIARVDEPLRTPNVTYRTGEDGLQHVIVEVITVGGD